MELTSPQALPSALRDSCKHLSLVPDQRLFRQGDRTALIFVVMEGRLRLCRRTLEGREATLAVVLDKGILGEEALFSERYMGSAIADTATQLLAYPAKVLLENITQHPPLATELLQLIGKKVQSLQTLLELRSIRSAALRVQQYLRYQSQANQAIHIEGTWKAVATELSLTPQTLSKALAQLEQTGQIDRKPEGIYLQDGA
ncbi:MAG: Crp/Fnr family transcriptional regulator [Cyanobacteria bacterium P01_A01_bin.105]